jgi:hypothetical protein
VVGVQAAVGDVGVRETLARAREHLLSLQDEQGWRKGALDTNVTMDAEDLLMREFLGIRTAVETEAAARWIRSQQADAGSWAVFHAGPGDLSTTVEPTRYTQQPEASTARTSAAHKAGLTPSRGCSPEFRRGCRTNRSELRCFKRSWDTTMRNPARTSV